MGLPLGKFARMGWPNDQWSRCRPASSVCAARIGDPWLWVHFERTGRGRDGVLEPGGLESAPTAGFDHRGQRYSAELPRCSE